MPSHDSYRKREQVGSTRTEVRKPLHVLKFIHVTRRSPGYRWRLVTFDQRIRRHG